MTDAGPVARAAGLAALGHRGDLTPTDVATLLHACSDDPDARVRAAALGALVRTGLARAAPPEEVDAAWRAALADADTAVRRRACDLAPTLASTRVGGTLARSLVPVLADREVTVVEAAAWALGELGDDAIDAGAVAPLTEIARAHDDPLAREAAVAALGALGDDGGLPAILDACRDKPAVRRRAVLALAPFDGPAVEAAIEAALTDRDWQVRQAAEDLLGVDADEAGAGDEVDGPP